MRCYEGEAGYLQLLKDILSEGVDTPDRTGHGRRKLFDCNLEFDLKDGFPTSTIRPLSLRLGFEEFWAFLNGVVFLHPHLKAKGINFWEGNTTREFLDARGLNYLPEGHCGKSYGFQYRHFNGELDKDFMPVGGVDQISNVYNSLKNDPYSSRHQVTLLNPDQEVAMPLPACVYGHQFIALPNDDGGIDLNLKVTVRSSDTCYGLFVNTMQLSLYLYAIAKSLGYTPRKVSLLLIDAHIYQSQIPFAKEMVERDKFELPMIEIKKQLNSLEDVLSMQYEDIELHGLKVNREPFKVEKPSMAV